MRADYALIVGQGRSGTNWLLDLFDQSSETFCRNEPYGAAESPLNELIENRLYVYPDQGLLEERWDEAARSTSVHMGERDHGISVPKAYLYEFSRVLGLCRAVQGPRSRRLLRLLLPSLRGGQWRAPSWVANPRKLAEATAILKLVTSPGWAVFVLRRRPTVPVFHIVRHPGGFLNSWVNRWVAGQDTEQNLRDEQQRLRGVAELDREWDERFGEIFSMSIEQCALWYWMYANQVIYEAGKQSDQYHHIVYEDLVADPVAVMKPCYEATGLGWSSDIEARIARSALGSASIASAWRNKLSPERIQLVEEFLQMEPEFYPKPAGA